MSRMRMNNFTLDASNMVKDIDKERSDREAVEELIPLRKGGLMIGVPYETMRRYVKMRMIPYYKIGGRLKVHKLEIRDWYNARKIIPLNSATKNRCEVTRYDTFRSQEEGPQQEVAFGSVRR
jgi:hypothetical protein